MNEESYLSERVENQIDWYGRKSQKAQRCFKRLCGFEIVSAAAIPLIAGFAQVPVGVLGSSITITSVIIGLNQYQENWTEYRSTCESLRHEKFLFLTKAEPYHEENTFHLFVQRIENLISKENSACSQYTQASIQKTQTSTEGKAGSIS